MTRTRRRAIFSLLLALVACVGCGRSPERRDLEGREAAAAHLARALPPELSRGPLLVIANPFTQKPGAPPDVHRYHESVLRGLSEGLGREIRSAEIVFPALKEGAWERPESFLSGRSLRTPLSSLMRPDAFDRLAAEQPDAKVFISIVGVPEGIERTAFWTNARAPALALYLPDFRAVPDARAWRAAFERGRIVAAVVEQAGYPSGRVIRSAADLPFPATP